MNGIQSAYAMQTCEVDGDIFRGVDIDAKGETFNAYYISKETKNHLSLFKKEDRIILQPILKSLFDESVKIYLTAFSSADEFPNQRKDYDNLIMLMNVYENLDSVKSGLLTKIRDVLPANFTPQEERVFVAKPFYHSVHNYTIIRPGDKPLLLSIVFTTPRNFNECLKLK